MAPLFVSRVPTVYSLQQLEEEYATPQKGALSHPLKPVADLASSLLPRLACLSCTTAVPSKRIRSFGDLQSILPDSDEDRCAASFLLRHLSQDICSLEDELWSYGQKSDTFLRDAVHHAVHQQMARHCMLLFGAAIGSMAGGSKTM